jgi:hypothetical protein
MRQQGADAFVRRILPSSAKKHVPLLHYREGVRLDFRHF